MDLILASASPRRAELLASAGFVFDVLPADVDETPWAGEEPQAYALRVAAEKAAVAAARCEKPRTPILAADTVVVAGGHLLGKPADRGDAERMLKLLADRTHEVHTAVVVRFPGQERREVVTTQVHFLPLTDEEIRWYISTGEPNGKAGAYAIQGYASRFVDWIEGSWSNVVGLPVATVYQLISAGNARRGR